MPRNAERHGDRSIQCRPGDSRNGTGAVPYKREECSLEEFCSTDILRDEWGFDGLVASDWGAVDERVPSLCAGLELEMPSSGGIGDKKIVEAVKSGNLPESVLDRAVE